MRKISSDVGGEQKRVTSVATKDLVEMMDIGRIRMACSLIGLRRAATLTSARIPPVPVG